MNRLWKLVMRIVFHGAKRKPLNENLPSASINIYYLRRKQI